MSVISPAVGTPVAVPVGTPGAASAHPSARRSRAGISYASRAARHWPSLVESLLALAAIVALLPLFADLAGEDSGRDGRFANAGVAVGGLPDRALPGLCASYSTRAEPLVRDRLCRGGDTRGNDAPLTAMPIALVDAYAQTGRAFQRPLADADVRRIELRLQQREGLGDLLALGNAIEAIDADTRPYMQRYQLGRIDAAAPLPLACAYEMTRAATARARGPASEGDAVALANAMLLLGGAFDGHGAVAGLAGAALLPRASSASVRGCGALALADALSGAATLIAEARQARLESAKNEAMRGLLRTAGWQWAGWMLAGLVLLKLSRRGEHAIAGVALALAVWALAAWLGRVPWPLGADRAFTAGRESMMLASMPAPFVLMLLASSLCLLLVSVATRKRAPQPPQTMSSRIGYPGVVLATGLGWLLLLDLSANGNFGNRFLALYHQGHLWLGMLALTLVAFMRQAIGRGLGWTLSMLGALIGKLRHRVGTIALAGATLALTAVVVGGLGAALANAPQVTSEIGRAWLIVGASWFFFMRGDPLAERLARHGGSLASLVRYLAPLLFVALLLVGIQVVTRDMGPLLIAYYGAGAFVAAAIAMWSYQRSESGGMQRWPLALAVALFIAWIVVTTVGLFELGALHDVTAGRLENLAAPLVSANDQLALVTWFQRAAPPGGFGVGAVPWCGYAAAVGCPGVPAQIQSDYTLTALVGVFGWATAWTFTIAFAIWLHRLIRHHGRVTRGEPRLVAAAGRVVNDHQALLSWIAVTWVVLALCQLAVTVAGNLAVLPLTGVTFPFVSFGMTSLVVNMAFLGLAISVNVPEKDAHG